MFIQRLTKTELRLLEGSDHQNQQVNHRDQPGVCHIAKDLENHGHQLRNRESEFTHVKN